MNKMMNALVVQQDKTVFTQIPCPQVAHSQDLLIRVNIAGICRTDIMVAQGKIPNIPNTPFGHEFCGTVIDIHPDSVKQDNMPSFTIGDRVTVNPVIPCHNCQDCQNGNTHLCGHTKLLGIEHAGAFAEYISVPARQCYHVPEELPDTLCAYLEPIAAMLSILHCDITPQHRVAVIGEDRIANLCHLILETENIQTVGKETANPVDILIVTSAIEHLPVERLKAGGKIIIKSRLTSTLKIDFVTLVQQRLTIQGVNYAPFNEALDFLIRYQKELKPFIGKTYALKDFAKAFSEENIVKTFLQPASHSISKEAFKR